MGIPFSAQKNFLGIKPFLILSKWYADLNTRLAHPIGTNAIDIGFFNDFFDGMMGKPFVNEGVYITKQARAESRLVTITQLDPILVTGFVPYEVFASRRKVFSTDEAAKTALEYSIILPDGTEYPHKGKPSSGGYEFDRDTQRIIVTATFPNPRLLLRPGLEVTIRSRLLSGTR